MPQVPAVGRGEVIMTPAEAKQLKLQKGYTLEPVFVTPAVEAPPVIVTGKRERKKSNHFGNAVMPLPLRAALPLDTPWAGACPRRSASRHSSCWG